MKTQYELTQYIRELAVIECNNKTRLAQIIKIDSDTVDSISFHVFKRDAPYKFFEWMEAHGYRMNHYEIGLYNWVFVKDFSFKVPMPPPPNSSEYLPTTIKMKTFYCASCGLQLWSNEEVYFYKCKCGMEDII